MTCDEASFQVIWIAPGGAPRDTPNDLARTATEAFACIEKNVGENIDITLILLYLAAI
jgi:hypothetical protein